MTRPLSVRTRLTLWYSAVLFAVLVVAGLTVVSLHRRLGIQRVDRELMSAAETVSGVLHNEIDDEHLSLPDGAADMVHELNLPGFGVAIVAPGAGIIASTEPRPISINDQVIDAAAAAPAFAESGNDRYRIWAMADRTRESSYTITVWTSLQPLTLESTTLQEAIWLGVPLALALASAGGSLIAKHSLRPLDDSLRLQRTFMADASHQLRTPVSVIRTAAEVTLSRTDRTTDEYRESLEIVGRQSERLTKMVDDMFMLAMADAEGRPLQRAPLYVNELLDDVVRDAQPLAIERRITLTYEAPDDVVLSGDEDLLRHMTWNLVENAVRHSPAGGVIRLSLGRSSDAIEITISDDGPGIAPEDRHRIFDRFVRLESSSGGAGAGLGLPIARWIAEAHGGRLTLDDTPRGCCFRVRLPGTMTSS